MNPEAECNLEKLKERLQEIENSFLGLKTPVAKLICGRNGEVTDEKVRELAERVIWRECNLHGKMIGISGRRKRYYELLFYLILRAYDPEEKIHDFMDFLEAARQLAGSYQCYEELILHDAGMLPGHAFFYKPIYESCKILTGRSLSDDFCPAELEKMERDYKGKQSMWEKKKKEMKRVFAPDQEEREAVWEKYRDYGVEGMDSYDALNNEYYYKYAPYLLDGLTEKYDDPFVEYEENKPDEQEITDEQRTLLQERGKERAVEQERIEQARRGKWAASFDDPEKYLEAYREFSHLNFLEDALVVDQNLKASLLDILEEKGFNKLDDENRFTRIYAELNRILRMTRSRF